MKTTVTKTGRIISGTYGTQYDAGSDTVITARIKHGKIGRPKAPPAPVYSKTNDLFSRVPDTVIPTFTGGRVIIGNASVNAVYADEE